MRGLRFSAVAFTAIALAACGGGGATGPRGGPAAPQTTLAPARSATTTMSLAIPIRKTNAHARKPSFVSPGLQSIAFYDANELVYVANVDLAAGPGASPGPSPSAGPSPSPAPSPTQGPQFQTFYSAPGAPTVLTPQSCTSDSATETCTVSVTTTPGRHIFGLVAYPNQQSGTPPPNTGFDPGPAVTLKGIISSEGQVTMTLAPGPNPGATLTMLGVASSAYVTSDSEEVELPYETPTSFPYQILDSAYAQILTPGDYDNGPVTFTATQPVFTVSPASVTTPPSSPGDQTVTVTCTAVNGGSATLLISAKNGPNTSYASGLVYTQSNYFSGGILATLLISCDPQPPQ